MFRSLGDRTELVFESRVGKGRVLEEEKVERKPWASEPEEDSGGDYVLGLPVRASGFLHIR